MYKIAKKFLFLMNPESAHKVLFFVLKLVRNFKFIRRIFRNNYTYEKPELSKEICGLKFQNPVGLAAGLDKNAETFDILSDFGFGFIEIGTVTPRAQSGNPKPRLFRLVKDEAIINRMGFNNMGVMEILDNIKKRKGKILIGGNIGKNSDTSNENAVADYIKCFKYLWDVVDYFTVNVSCPNVPNMASLQNSYLLNDILKEIQVLNHYHSKPKPIFLKIAPNSSNSQIDEILEICETNKIDGIVATNTSPNRENLTYKKRQIDKFGNGGLSGKPLTDISTEMIRYIRSKNSKIAIIGVGGIMSAKDAIDKLNAGADLIQIYTGFIYKGPELVKEILVEYEKTLKDN